MKIDVICEKKDPETGYLLNEIWKRGYNGEYVNPKKVSYLFSKKIQLFLNGKPYKTPDIALARTGFSSTIEKEGRMLILTLKALGVKIVEKPETVLQRKEKVITAAVLTANKIPYPKTLYLSSRADLKLVDFSPIVVKPVTGRRGQGLRKVKKREEIKTFPCFAQEYIPHPGRDIRVLVVGGKVFYAMHRIARKGWVTNVSQGARVEFFKPNNTLAALAKRVAQALSLDIVGVDVLEHKGKYVVLEANRAPQFSTAMKHGIDVAKEIIDYVEKRK